MIMPTVCRSSYWQELPHRYGPTLSFSVHVLYVTPTELSKHRTMQGPKRRRNRWRNRWENVERAGASEHAVNDNSEIQRTASWPYGGVSPRSQCGSTRNYLPFCYPN